MGEVLQFSAEAQNDVKEAVLFYEGCSEGLGARFNKELRDVTLSIIGSPLIRRERKEGYRQANMPSFPYYMTYIMEGELIILVAVAHSSRHPDFWKDRLT